VVCQVGVTSSSSSKTRGEFYVPLNNVRFYFLKDDFSEN
jgi:hypothetical protein